MKINTDGVLLGAMAGSEALPSDKPVPNRMWKSRRFLDIGTGTGVIALMLAQRYPDARVDAIEIDAIAAQRAKANFLNSPFSDRLKVSHIALRDFQAEPYTYDLIVSNPPFFMDSLKNPDQRKSVARHADPLFFQTLLEVAVNYLRSEGILQLILPVDLAKLIVDEAVTYGLAEAGQTEIYSFAEDEKPVRVILTLIRKSEMQFVPRIETFIIYADRGQYSMDYKMLLKDFFLDL